MKRLALIGDYDAAAIAHRAIPPAVRFAAAEAKVAVEIEWIGTGRVDDPARTLAGFAGIWAVPATPYRDMEGALAAIRYAREHDIPFLGTCGGFQHALIEFARNVMGLTRADHAETSTADDSLVVTRLSCSLVEVSNEISFTPGSQLGQIFAGRNSVEGYHCNYGPNPEYRDRFEAAGLRFTGFDAAGEARAAELPANRFFVGTLFQPERSSLRSEVHPLVLALIRAL